MTGWGPVRLCRFRAESRASSRKAGIVSDVERDAWGNSVARGVPDAACRWPRGGVMRGAIYGVEQRAVHLGVLPIRLNMPP